VPTNLSPEARNKWAEVSAARNSGEKLRLLKEFLSLVPKHKGTAKLCVQVKKQISALRRETEEKRKKRAKYGPRLFIEKEGAAQIVLIGLTNSGKSSLIAATTNAKVQVSPNPYTTLEPVPGMLPYQDIQFQLIEAPALLPDFADRRTRGPQTLALARNADGLILMVDRTKDPVGQLSTVLDKLEKARVLVTQPKTRVDVEKKFVGAGLRIVLLGRLIDCTVKDVEQALKSYGIRDAVVKIYGEAVLDDVEEAIFESTVYKPAIVVANKSDIEGSTAELEKLEAAARNQLPLVAVSCKTLKGLERLGEALFKMLNVMRVYTKEPGSREPSKRPYILKKDATVHDLARSIHSDFDRNFSYARLWSDRLIFSPKRVGATFTLQDGDVVEIHMK